MKRILPNVFSSDGLRHDSSTPTKHVIEKRMPKNAFVWFPSRTVGTQSPTAYYTHLVMTLTTALPWRTSVAATWRYHHWKPAWSCWQYDPAAAVDAMTAAGGAWSFWTYSFGFGTIFSPVAKEATWMHSFNFMTLRFLLMGFVLVIVIFLSGMISAVSFIRAKFSSVSFLNIYLFALRCIGVKYRISTIFTWMQMWISLLQRSCGIWVACCTVGIDS